MEILQDGKGCTALVREEDRTISVSVKGAQKSEFLSRLRETLNDIFNSFKSEKPDLQYRVERFGRIPEEVEKSSPVWVSGDQILTHSQMNIPYLDPVTRQLLPMDRTVQIYQIAGDNVLMQGSGHTLTKDYSTRTFNFHNCNIGLQSDLNELGQLLEENGKKEESKELRNAAAALEKVEKCENREEVKKKGIANRLRRVVESMEDEKSILHKTIKGLKNGVGIAQDIAAKYNDIAQWLGMPQVPKPFLKK